MVFRTQETEVRMKKRTQECLIRIVHIHHRLPAFILSPDF